MRKELTRRQIFQETVIEWVIRLCGISAIVFVFSIFIFVFKEGAPFLLGGEDGRLDLGTFFGSIEWYPASAGEPTFGILALIAGTASVSLLAMVFSVPFGLGAAIFISEFCGAKTKEILKVVIELLAAIPSVVWGFIGMTLMKGLIETVFNVPFGLTVLNGAIILALMCLPIIVSISEDALRAVPDSYREAAIGLGVTKWQMVWRVLVPAAKNGLLAAALLGVGRAVGETMAVLMATGHAVNVPGGAFESVRTLTATIAAELGETAEGSPHYRVLFIIGIFLFCITFAINLTADLVIRGIKKQ